MYRPASLLAVLAALSAGAFAKLSMTNIATECADSKGFNTCWSGALSEAEQCYKSNCQGEGTCTDENDCTASNPNCVEACSCVAYTAFIQCALTSCWNKVYSCEYQNLAVSAAENCPIAITGSGNPFATTEGWQWIPYFPSNTSHPSACSCDIGFTYLSQRQALSEHTACYNNYAQDRTEALYQCDCCSTSKQVSAFLNQCPNTDPAAVLSTGDMPNFPYAQLAGSERCDTLLSQTDCTQIGFHAPSMSDVNAKFFSGSDLPSNGTQALADTSGTIDTPLLATITWAIGAGQPSQTAVAVMNEKKSDTGSSSSGSDQQSNNQTETGGDKSSDSGSAQATASLLLTAAIAVGGVVFLL